MTKYKLLYFPIRGRGEWIRFLFAAANIPYEEVLVDRSEWPKLKAEMPFGQLPILEVDDVRISQSVAISRFLAREFGLYGGSSLEQARIDMLVEGVQEVKDAPKKALFEGDEEKKEAWRVFREQYVLPVLRRYTGFLNESKSGWFVGESMTWADIAVAEFLDCLDMFEKGILQEYHELKEHQERVLSNPGIAKRVATRPQWAF